MGVLKKIFIILAFNIGVLSTSHMGIEKAVLTKAPFVPPYITRRENKKVVASLRCREGEAVIAKGVRYKRSTFEGEVPGPMIRILEGDHLELQLINPIGNLHKYSICLNALTGPGGGSGVTVVAPGETAIVIFKALNPGPYIYYCGTMPVGERISNGMYGMIFVQPKNYSRVDKEFYIMQGEVYTNGAEKFASYGRSVLAKFDIKNALAEKPSFVFFNGLYARHTIKKEHLVARVGDVVRMYVGNAGPNLISSFHIMGEIFDKVYIEGGAAINKNVQTTLVPPGGAVIVELKVEFPGYYAFIDHSMFRALYKGAIGVLRVEGKANPAVFSSVKIASHNSKAKTQGLKSKKKTIKIKKHKAVQQRN